MGKETIENFVKELAKEFPTTTSGVEFKVEFGSKFAKISTFYTNTDVHGTDSTVWGFVAMKSFEFGNETLKFGDLLKAASWKKPAKISRGNIVDKSAMYDQCGPCYMDAVKELRSFSNKLSLL